MNDQTNDRGIPIIPKLPDDWPARRGPTDPNPVVAICGECGLEIRAVMMYACQNPRCPTGLGPVICSGGSP